MKHILSSHKNPARRTTVLLETLFLMSAPRGILMATGYKCLSEEPITAILKEDENARLKRRLAGAVLEF